VRDKEQEKKKKEKVAINIASYAEKNLFVMGVG
jgi:hypothetical protein